jgi:hypothetical protein
MRVGYPLNLDKFIRHPLSLKQKDKILLLSTTTSLESLQHLLIKIGLYKFPQLCDSRIADEFEQSGKYRKGSVFVWLDFESQFLEEQTETRKGMDC